MGKTIAEKILSEKSQKDVHAGDFVVADISACFAHSGNHPLACELFHKMGFTKVFDPDRVIMFNDHEPNSHTPALAEKQRIVRAFARDQKLSKYCELGEGICHLLMPEKGYVGPGDLVVGTDSHCCTYGAVNTFATAIGSSDMACVMEGGKLWFRVPETIKIVLTGSLQKGVYAKDVFLYIIGRFGADAALYQALEFTGPALSAMSMDSRFTICNMAVEMGAKTALMEIDGVAEKWLKSHHKAPYTQVYSDSDAVYSRVIQINVSEIVPMLAKPHFVENVVPVSSAGKIPVDIAYIGSCTNGRLEDLSIAAGILKDKKISPALRLYVTPGSLEVYKEALSMGIIYTLVEAGAIVSPPGCNGCGNAFACPADGQNVLSTANRNFKGRKGNTNGFIYLASPATVAASALTGELTDCRNYL